MKGTLYLIDLSGAGDQYIFLVEKDVFDWINSDDTFGRVGDETSWTDTAAPDAVLAGLESGSPGSDEPGRGPYVSNGSFKNDRALQSLGASVKSFHSMLEFVTWIKENDVTLGGEFSGSIY